MDEVFLLLFVHKKKAFPFETPHGLTGRGEGGIVAAE